MYQKVQQQVYNFLDELNERKKAIENSIPKSIGRKRMGIFVNDVLLSAYVGNAPNDDIDISSLIRNTFRGYAYYFNYYNDFLEILLDKGFIEVKQIE